MSKLYCEPEVDMSVTNFFEAESNVNLQPKRRKTTEKKTPLPKCVNINVHKSFKSLRDSFKTNAMISIF